MSLIAKDNSGSDFDPVSAGMHHAICYGVCDVGTQPQNDPKFRPTRKVVFLWELPEERIDIEKEKDGVKQKVNLPRASSAKFTLSLGKKSNLRPMLESWRGRNFTDEELAGFDVMNVVGANCMLNIVHNQKGAKTYANVKSVNPLPKGMAKRTLENPPLKFSLDDSTGPKITFPERMPDWIKALVLQSDEYLSRSQERGQPDNGGESQGHEAEDDIPF